MKTEPNKISSHTLIDKVLELQDMQYDSITWTFEQQKSNPSRLIRLKQISALLQLFLPDIYNTQPLPKAIESVLQGHFVRNRKIEDYGNVINQMDHAITQAEYPLKKDTEWSLHTIEFNYRQLMRFKIMAYNLIEFNTGIMEISYPSLYTVAVADEILQKIKLKKLNSFLATVVDPEGRTFSRDQLIKNYNYPKEDIYMVDADNYK